jgi:hypothetical protein
MSGDAYTAPSRPVVQAILGELSAGVDGPDPLRSAPPWYSVHSVAIAGEARGLGLGLGEGEGCAEVDPDPHATWTRSRGATARIAAQRGREAPIRLRTGPRDPRDVTAPS